MTGSKYDRTAAADMRSPDGRAWATAVGKGARDVAWREDLAQRVGLLLVQAQ